MAIELAILAWGCVLGLVHIFAAIHVKTRQYGTAWNVSPRDEALPPPSPLAGRLSRAQANFFETFPIAAAAILIVTVAGLTSPWTALGAALWLSARLLYLPLYATGVRYVRSGVFAVSLVGIAMLLWPALFGGL